MIVEVFIKGTCFKEQYNTFWNIKSISEDGKYFILITEDGTDNILLDMANYELRVTY